MGRFNDEKEHYKSLISLFKYGVTLITSLVALIGIGVAYVTYGNSQEMRQELRDKKSDLQNQVDALKSDLKYNENKMSTNLKDVATKVNNDLDKTRADALTEVENIKITARLLAEQEAKNKISEVFKANNIEDYTMKMAKEMIEPKLNSIVDEKFASTLKDKTQSAIENITSNDINKVTVGWIFFSNNPELELSDKQLNTIVNSFDKKPNNSDNLKTYLAMVLYYRKSTITTNFFKRVIYEDDQQLSNISMQYFVKYNVENSFFIDYILSKMNQTNDCQAVYQSVLQTSRLLNENYTIYLLNNKSLVNKVFNSLDLQSYSALKNVILSELSKSISEKDFKNTFFFTIN